MPLALSLGKLILATFGAAYNFPLFLLKLRRAYPWSDPRLERGTADD